MAGAKTISHQKMRAPNRPLLQRRLLQRRKEGRTIGDVRIDFRALENGKHSLVQMAMNVLARSPAAPEHHRQLRRLLVPRNHGNGRVGIARLDPLQPRAHAEYPHVAPKSQPRFDLLLTNGPGRIFE